MSLEQTKINRLIALYVFAIDYYSAQKSRGMEIAFRARRRLIKRWGESYFDYYFAPCFNHDNARQMEFYKILEAKYGSKI
jgi:hypothetical protein